MQGVARWPARLYPLLLAAAAREAAGRLGLVRPLFLPPLTSVLAAMPGLKDRAKTVRVAYA